MPKIKMFTLIKNKILLSFLLSLISLKAFATLEIVITEGVDSARPIAVLPFKWNGMTPPPENISGIVSADLLRSGKFGPINASRFPQVAYNDSEIDYTLHGLKKG